MKRLIVSQNLTRAQWAALTDEDVDDRADDVRDAMRVTNTSRVSARMGEWSK